MRFVKKKTVEIHNNILISQKYKKKYDKMFWRLHLVVYNALYIRIWFPEILWIFKRIFDTKKCNVNFYKVSFFSCGWNSKIYQTSYCLTNQGSVNLSRKCGHSFNKKKSFCPLFCPTGTFQLITGLLWLLLLA